MSFAAAWIAAAFGRHVKAGIECIEVFEIQFFLNGTEGFTETLEMHNFSFTQETDGVHNIRISDDTQNVVISGARFLFWGDLVSTTYTKI